MSVKVGTTDILLNGNRKPGVRTMETNLGDLCADAFLWQARLANVLSKGSVDGAIVNGGGIRGSIKPGTITVGSISSIMPYNNQLYIVKIKGVTLLEMLEAATCTIPEAIGAFPQVAGIKYVINTAIPYTNGKQYPHSTYFAPAKPGSRIEILEVNGKPFELSGEYTIAGQEFLCRGGDAYGALLTPGVANIHSIGYIDNAALINYIKEELHGVVGPTYAQPQGRVVIK
jgi:5'-nucleotidase/UDP-sugar diphosphatase